MAAALAMMLVATTVAAASPLPIEILKSAYLDCERAAVDGKLGQQDIMECSVIYEELKRRAFDGDYARMRAWWRNQKDQAVGNFQGTGRPATH
jgi:hypothetical protein